jgi:hypothetical protein
MRRAKNKETAEPSLPDNSLTAKAVLQLNYLFRGLPHTVLGRIASLAARGFYGNGAVVFAHGDRGDAL